MSRSHVVTARHRIRMMWWMSVGTQLDRQKKKKKRNKKKKEEEKKKKKTTLRRKGRMRKRSIRTRSRLS